ncbi:sensor histidine kinase [soil metagenome]
MENPRWWHIAVTVMAAVLVIIVLFTPDSSPTSQLGACLALAAFVLGWFLLGRHAFTNAAAAIALTIIISVSVGVAVAFYPLMAILQCVAYPLVWVISVNLRGAIIANVGVAAAVGAGFLVSTGDVAQAVATCLLSVVFSLALGLWITRIAEQSEERRALLADLRAAQDQLAAANRDAGVTSERERLAREIHDTIAQDLTGLVMLAQRARREHDTGATNAETLALIEDNARAVLAETRSLVAGRATVGVEEGGIIDSLTRLAQRFSRETGITVGVEAENVPALDRDTEVVLLRVAQEGLANVRKHAGAESAVVQLRIEGGAARLDVRDDGGGFDPLEASNGYGLTGMRERLALVGGDLEVSSGSDGTTLTATLPVGAAT